METCMFWGFECSSGWYKLIWDLSEKLEALIIKYKEENPGEEWSPRAMQVKEKMGGLRFYLSGETDEMSKEVEKAEQIADETCEECGKPGALKHRGTWYRTLCDDCRDKENYEDCERNEDEKIYNNHITN